MRPLSPAQRHKARILQEKQQAATPYGQELQGSAYDLIRAKFAQDKRRLGEIQSHERRAQIKATLIPEYLDWIETAIEKGQGARDDVLTGVMVWCFDAGAYALGLRIADYVISNNMPMGDAYQRTPAAIVIDELANAYLKGQWSQLRVNKQADGTATLEQVVDQNAFFVLSSAAEITRAYDAPDQARAKLHKAIAYALLGKVQTAEDPELDGLPYDTLQTALTGLQRALELDANSGVKKDIERVARAIAKTPEAKATAPANAVEPTAPESDTQQPATTAQPAQAAKPAKATKPAAARKTAATAKATAKATPAAKATAKRTTARKQ